MVARTDHLALHPPGAIGHHPCQGKLLIQGSPISFGRVELGQIAAL